VTNATGQEVRGLAADGREVTLRVSPHPGGDGALSAAVVVDRSGSMNVACSSHPGAVTKHEAVVRGLKNVAEGLNDADIIDLWEFDDRLTHVGPSRGPGARNERGRERFLSRIARLRGPGGGTEIGAALSGTIAGSSARDILLITDGQSYALNVQALARKGRRITAVLVGEDSLEANVGHLAALSGGDIFVATGDDIVNFLTAAIGALRLPSEQPGPAGASLDRVRVVRGNTVLEAEWKPVKDRACDVPHNRCVAAMAASLALPVLDKEPAAALAEAEGLVTHLTSLVLVDEAGEVQQGVPASRKIALPAPRVSHPSAGAVMARRQTPAPSQKERCFSMSALTTPQYSADLASSAPKQQRQQSGRGEAQNDITLSLQKVAQGIDWTVSPNQLLAGDLSALDPQDALLIKRAAELPEVVAIAAVMNIDPAVLVVALIAQSQSAGNRSAGRVAKAIFGDQFPDRNLLEIAEMLGLRAGASM
jgi:hypothetical protein